jgi:hypothetical protein
MLARMSDPIRTPTDLIGRLGGPAVMAAAGVGRTALANWRARGGIPPRHWPALVDLASARGIEGVTWETLRRLSAPDHEPPAGADDLPVPPASGGEGVRAHALPAAPDTIGCAA